MAFKIERALTGLFQALRLQSQGNLPATMAEEVIPTLDLNLYAMQAWQARTRHIPGAAIPLALGDIATFTAQSPLLVIGASVEIFAYIVGDGGNLKLTYRRPQLSTAPFNLVSVRTPAGPTVATNTGNYTNTITFGTPFWIGAQDVIALNCDRVDGVATGWGQLLTYQPAIDT